MLKLKRMKTARSLITTGLASVCFLSSVAAHAGCNAEYAYTAEICFTAASYCPENTAQANGQLVAITDFEALFALIGNAYGGDGRTNFALPDLRGRLAVGTGTGVGLSPVYRGEMRGQETVILTEDQLARHSHGATFDPNPSDPVELNASTATASSSKPLEKPFLAEANTQSSDVNIYGPENDLVPIGGVTGGQNNGGSVVVDSSGANQPISVLNPQLAFTACIVTNGSFPPRP